MHEFKFSDLRLDAWRVVEDQHSSSTLKLVDSVEEHEVLELLLEKSKPPLASAEFQNFHYLLTTPFRYPPLRYGSRFGRNFERGIWYGAAKIETCFCETAYYRFLFRSAVTGAQLPPFELTFTGFSVGLKSAQAVDLTLPAYAHFKKPLVSKTDYSFTQRVGSQLRESGVDFFLYHSARSLTDEINIGVFAPSAFMHRQPSQMQNWRGTITDNFAMFQRQEIWKKVKFQFQLDQFQVEGHLPTPSC